MDQEETKTDAPVKPAKTRAPRKNARSKAHEAAPEGDAGIPAASPAPEKKVSKPRSPRRKKEAQPEAPSAEAEATVPQTGAEPAAPAQQEPERPAHPRKHNRVRRNESAPEPEAEKSGAEPAAEQKEDVPREELPDVTESPSADFRKPSPVPGFAMPEVVGGSEVGGNSRRKRRRNRNRNREDSNRDPQQSQQTPKVDSEELCRRAWKIFLGEVTEDGLALMDDRTAAEASRRAFKVAEIFLLEAARHRPAPERPVAESDSEAVSTGLSSESEE